MPSLALYLGEGRTAQKSIIYIGLPAMASHFLYLPMTIYEAWRKGCGGGVAGCCSRLWHRSLGSLLVGPSFQELHALARVVLPVQHSLIINEFTALPIDYFLPEVLKLQQVQEVKAHGVSEKRMVLLFIFLQYKLKTLIQWWENVPQHYYKNLISCEHQMSFPQKITRRSKPLKIRT